RPIGLALYAALTRRASLLAVGPPSPRERGCPNSQHHPFTCNLWHTHAVIQFAFSIFLVLWTQQDQIEITAAGQQGWQEHIYHAKDNVVVTYRDMRLAADEVTYDDNAKILTANGRLKFSRSEEQLDASHASLNVETKAGDFSNVSGKMGPG